MMMTYSAPDIHDLVVSLIKWCCVCHTKWSKKLSFLLPNLLALSNTTTQISLKNKHPRT